jgi:carbonic anhydrase
MDAPLFAAPPVLDLFARYGSMGMRVRWDLGLSALRRDWAVMFRRQDLRDDVVSGVSVALLAIPLSLAIALASGVPPAAGLASAIVAGVVAAWFGGTPLAVTGPAAAMAVLIMNVVEHHGMGGLLVTTLAVGLLQLVTGVLGFGRVARLVPLPVIEGFTAGIGAIILVGQLPRALGLKPPEESHVIDVITHIGDLFHESRPIALAVALGSLAICLFAPKLHKRLPGPLLAVIVPSAVVIALGIQMEGVGEIPRALAPHWPSFDLDLGSLVSPIVMVFALASLESLLSAAAVDKLARGARHDPDQEFIGQGLANMGAALFGGIPVTGVIARSALNVQAGAKTRRSALFHAVIVFALVMGAAPLLELIPVAALAGVLMSVALRMLDPRPLISLYKTSRADAVVYAVTFLLMVSLDLIEGVQWGLGAAFVVAALWSTRNRAQLRIESEGVQRLTLEGSLTFLTAIKFDELRDQTSKLAPGSAVILDLSAVNHVDASGAEYVADLGTYLLDRKIHVVLLGMQPDVSQRVLLADHEQRLLGHIAGSEAEMLRILPRAAGDSRTRLSHGVAAYRRVHRPRYEALFKSLATSQSPHTLFITCADSRVVPSLITATDPGELFILRNVGNMIPPWSRREAPASAAGVEYAVGILNVSEVVVCGHSGCGAIGALRKPHTVPAHLESLQAWLNEASARHLCDHVPGEVADDEVARMNALLQLQNLRTYDIVKERESKGELRLRAWFFDIGSGEIEHYDGQTKRWERLGEQPDPETGAAAPAVEDSGPRPAPLRTAEVPR